MAHYRIEYEDQGDLQPERVDVWAYRVAVLRDGQRLGVWTGGVEGATLHTQRTDQDLAQFHRNGVVATARKLQDMAERGELPSEYDQEVHVIPLGVAEVENAAPSRGHEWQAGDTVLEFDA